MACVDHRVYRRASDPETSDSAALKMVESGRVANQRQRILDDLALHDGATAAEMEERTGVRCHRRMAALERDGLVKRGLPRTCEATGMRATTWWKTTHPAGGWRT